MFRTHIGESIFKNKYVLYEGETWSQRCTAVVNDVCGNSGGTKRSILSNDDIKILTEAMIDFKWLPGGRYLYYGGRTRKFYNNCLLMRAEDTREGWAQLANNATGSLMSGAGIGIDYSLLRPNGSPIHSTGGLASGPISLMEMINEIGRRVMQGGSRRSALYASLNFNHKDASSFLHCKDWDSMIVGDTTIGDLKRNDFNYPAPLDMTNVSLNYDDSFLEEVFGLPIDHLKEIYKTYGSFGISKLPVVKVPDIFVNNCRQALKTGEPGFSFNFFDKVLETLRNAPVSANTRVLTKEGYQYVGDVVNTPITIWTGKQWTDTTFKKTHSDIPTLRVSLSNGRSIDCDPTHPFIIWTKGGKNRIEAKDLVEGSSVVCELPQDKEVVHGEDYGLGFVYGDGSIRGSRGEISYHVDDKKVCFDKACFELGAYSKGVDNRAYFNCEYAKKPLKLTPSFIAGWFDADGCISNNLLRLSCVEVEPLMELQEALDVLGVKSVVRIDGKTGFGTNRVMYTLNVWKSSFERFKMCIPTLRVIPDIPDGCRQQNIKILSVEPTGILEDVFCCDVGVEEHSFMAEGVIISNCCEVVSEDDSDICNLASLNLANISSVEECDTLAKLVSKFLVCGTIRADVPYSKVAKVRDKNRRLGLGLMGVHEFLLKNNSSYEVTGKLRGYLEVYKSGSEEGANDLCDTLGLNKPVAYRAIAPTGTIGMLAGTTTGIEPLFAVAYKRRYLVGDSDWHYEYVVDGTAKELIERYNIAPSDIDTALTLAETPEKRIAFQADVQEYVDQAISSTINLPAWGSDLNNEEGVEKFAKVLAQYSPRLRGFTCYPDGARGGQPLTIVPYEEAVGNVGTVFKEHDVCDITNKGGSCGV